MSSGAQSARGRRFELVDGLRGFAALAVILPHAVGLFIYPHPSWLTDVFLRLADLGRSSVEVFFVVSGFAIAYSLRNVVNTGFSLGRFLLRRAVRLDPPYWVSILWSGVMFAFRAWATHHPIIGPSPAKLAAHLFYLQDLLHLGQFNVVFWTLCLEFQLYLAFAAMMRGIGLVLPRVAARPPRANADADLFGWVMVFAFFASLLLSHTVWPMLPGWFVPFFYLFLSGALAAWRVAGRVSERLFLVCLGSMALGLCFRPDLARLMGLLTTGIIYVAMRRDALHRWLASRPVQWLGRVSYSVYLVHAPFAVLLLGLRTRVAPDSKLFSFFCLALTYAGTLVLAWLLHRTVEAPCLRLSQRLKQGAALPERPLPAPQA